MRSVTAWGQGSGPHCHRSPLQRRRNAEERLSARGRGNGSDSVGISHLYLLASEWPGVDNGVPVNM